MEHKRNTLKIIAGVGAVASFAPSSWTKPIISSVVLPAHAQTSAEDSTAPTGADATINADVSGVATGTLAASDDTDNNPVVMIVSQPSGGGVTLSGLNYTYTATAGSSFSGSDTFTYKVVDSTGNESPIYTITVTAHIDDVAPVGAPAVFTADANGFATGALFASDDIDPNPVVEFAQQPTAINGIDVGLLEINNNVFTFQSAQGASYNGYGGALPFRVFTYRVRDAAGNPSPVYNVEINPF